jgi:hypothetical protein
MTTFTAPALTRAIRLAGYKDDEFKEATFLGITNGGQYCYEVLYFDNTISGDAYTKVFLTHDQFEGTVRADY